MRQPEYFEASHERENIIFHKFNEYFWNWAWRLLIEISKGDLSTGLNVGIVEPLFIATFSDLERLILYECEDLKVFLIG